MISSLVNWLVIYWCFNGNLQVKELNAQQGIVPQWCLIDTKMGLLSVHIEDAECFAAWSYAGTITGLRMCIQYMKLHTLVL
jgi:hypothetical protein